MAKINNNPTKMNDNMTKINVIIAKMNVDTIKMSTNITKENGLINTMFKYLLKHSMWFVPGKGKLMKQKFLILFVLMLFGFTCSNLFAIGARPRAMGGAFIAVSDDENAIWTNPSGMSQLDNGSLSLTSQVVERNQYMSDHLAYAGKMFQTGGSSEKVTLEDYLESDYEFRSEPEQISNYSWGLAFSRLKRSAELNDEIGNGFVSENKSGVTLGFATRFPIAERLTRRPELYAGMSLRYSTHDWGNPGIPDEDGHKDIFDLGLSFFYKSNERLKLGARIDNVISETHDVSSSAVRDNSTTFNLGGSYTFGEKRDTLVAMDIINVFNASRAPDSQLRLGLERYFMDNDLAMRIGSYDGTLTLGFGLKFFEGFNLDYSYENFTDVQQHHITVKVPF